MKKVSVAQRVARARKNAGRAPTLGAESIPGLEPEKTFQEQLAEQREELERFFHRQDAEREADRAAAARAAASPLPEGWIETWNPNSGQTLYVHHHLKIVTDERPAKEPAEQPAKQPAKRASSNKALGNKTRATKKAQRQQAVQAKAVARTAAAAAPQESSRAESSMWANIAKMANSNKDLGLKTRGNKTRTTESGAGMKTGDMKVNGKKTGDNEAGNKNDEVIVISKDLGQKTNRPNTAAAAAPLSSPLPEGWEEVRHPHCGKTFYVDHNRDITMWDRPRAATTAAPPARTAA